MKDTYNDVEIRQRNKKKHKRASHREDEYLDAGLPMELLKYIAFLIYTVVAVVCGWKFLGVSLAIVVITILIISVMGFLLHNAPIFVTILLAALILVVGMLTKNTDLVLCGIGNFICAVLVFRE